MIKIKTGLAIIAFLVCSAAANAQVDTVRINIGEKSGLKKGILGPLSTFSNNAFIISLSKDLISNTRLKSHDYDKVRVPSVSLLVEKGIRSNFGIGFGLGYHKWFTPQYNYHHHYVPMSFRAMYHINVHRSLDVYVGGAISFRNMLIVNSSEKTGEKSRNYNFKTSLHGLLGVRWYPTSKLGLFFEYGNDLTSFLKLGIVFRISA